MAEQTPPRAAATDPGLAVAAVAATADRCAAGTDTPAAGELGVLARSAGVAALAVGAAVAAGALWHGLALAAPDRQLLRALAAYALLLLPLFMHLRAHLPHRRFGSANTVTLFRAGIVCVLFAAFGEPWHGHAGWIAGAASVALALDGVDGWLARHRGSASRYGARFDMEIDAALGLALALLAWQSGHAGAWVLAAGALRYLFIAAMRRLPWLARPLPPSDRRKWLCVLQLIGLIACVAPVLPDLWRTAAAAVAVALVTVSFAIDIVWLAAHRHADSRSPPGATA
ncbi:MAG: CDP-alcohol phosphatidyltransferase family protein [Lautropia sp.]